MWTSPTFSERMVHPCFALTVQKGWHGPSFALPFQKGWLGHTVRNTKGTRCRSGVAPSATDGCDRTRWFAWPRPSVHTEDSCQREATSKSPSQGASGGLKTASADELAPISAEEVGTAAQLGRRPGHSSRLALAQVCAEPRSGRSRAFGPRALSLCAYGAAQEAGLGRGTRPAGSAWPGSSLRPQATSTQLQASGQPGGGSRPQARRPQPSGWWQLGENASTPAAGHTAAVGRVTVGHSFDEASAGDNGARSELQLFLPPTHAKQSRALRSGGVVGARDEHSGGVGAREELHRRS